MPRSISSLHGGVGIKHDVGLPGMDLEAAKSLVEAASHILCPYWFTTNGNIEVKYSVISSEPADRVREAQRA